MPTLFVASSKSLSDWGSDVGQSKFLFKLGVAEDAAAAVAEGWAGFADWVLLKSMDAGGLSEDEAIAKLAAREKMIDPALYPKLRGTAGVFKVKVETVERSMLLASLSDDHNAKPKKAKPVDFATYLLGLAAK